MKLLRALVAVGLFAFLALPVASRPAFAKYAAIVMDADTGAVLYQANADARHYPASLTKVMSLFLVFDALKAGKLSMDSKIKISHRAARQPASRLGIPAGGTISVRDAIMAMIVKSANDIATAVSEHLGGTERKFSALMNRKAQAIGMENSSFRNASGLPNRRQLVTARDYALMVRALQKQHPDFYKLFSARSFTWEGRKHDNHNRLLDRYEGADGVKTGYIRASGFNLAASATRSGKRLIGVVMGTRSPRARDLHMMGLLERGFEKATRGAISPMTTTATSPSGAMSGPSPPARRSNAPVAPAAGSRLARLTPPRRPAALAPQYRRRLCLHAGDSLGAGKAGDELGNSGRGVFTPRACASFRHPRHAASAEPACPCPHQHRAEPRKRPDRVPGPVGRIECRWRGTRLRTAQGQEPAVHHRRPGRRGKARRQGTLAATP